ncbi:MAG: energy transducer TonB [Draconibacterium sp.]
MKNKKSKKADLENKKGVFFLLGLVISLGMVLLAFQWKTPVNKAIVYENTDYVSDDYLFIPPTKNEERKPLSKPVIAPIIELVSNNTNTTADPDLFETEPGQDLLFNYNEIVYSSGKKEIEKEEEIFIRVEEMPEFPGGDISLQRYIANAIKYPIVAQEIGIQGKVFVSFVIDELGKITDVSIVRGVDSSLYNEALRVIRSLPKWKPGKQGGKAVKVRCYVPINFELR